MIFYFSATGNSKYTADKLAEQDHSQVISISEAIAQNQYSFSAQVDESIGFVVPLYFLGLPTIVNEFLSKLELKNAENNYLYLVLTCGDTTGEAAKSFKKILARKGYRVSANYAVAMVGNYVPLYDIVDEKKIEEQLAKADLQIERIGTQIQEKVTGDMDFCKGPMPVIITAIGYPLYLYGRKTSKFYATEDCTGCGLCEELCPCQTIQMTGGKPKWVKTKCTLCLGCLHRCPAKAIQYCKKTEQRGRYVNPMVSK